MKTSVKPIYNPSRFETRRERRQFEQMLLDVATNCAAASYMKHKRTASNEFNEFMSEAQLVAVEYSLKAQEIWLTQNPKNAASYVAKCVTMKLVAFGWNNNVRIAQNLSVDDVQTGNTSGDLLGYNKIETLMKNKNKQILGTIKEVATPLEFNIIYAYYYENMATRDVIAKFNVKGKNITSQKNRVIEKIILGNF